MRISWKNWKNGRSSSGEIIRTVEEPKTGKVYWYLVQEADGQKREVTPSIITGWSERPDDGRAYGQNPETGEWILAHTDSDGNPQA